MTATADSRTPVPVAHSHPEWLPKTQTWLFNQLRFTPHDVVESHVVCERVANLDQFAVPNLHCLCLEPRWYQLWDRGVRKTGLRRHLAFQVKTARRHGVQLLHSHFGNVGWRDLGVARALQARHVTTFYGYDVNQLPRDRRWRVRYEELFASVDRVLCEGGHMARAIIDLGCSSDKVRVHHLGVELDALRFVPRTWNGRGPLRVLVAGSFREKKGIPYAVSALAQLRGEIPIQLTIVGDAGPDPASQSEKQRILDLLDSSGLRSETRLLGYQPHRVLLDEGYAHHVFLSPSVTARDGDTEGGVPVTITEMLATGMPVVSSTHCDIPEVVHHGISGLLAPERDSDTLAAHLRWLVAHRDEWERLAVAGRRHVEAEYDARVQGRRLADLYQDCLRND